MKNHLFPLCLWSTLSVSLNIHMNAPPLSLYWIDCCKISHLLCPPHAADQIHAGECWLLCLCLTTQLPSSHHFKHCHLGQWPMHGGGRDPIWFKVWLMARDFSSMTAVLSDVSKRHRLLQQIQLCWLGAPLHVLFFINYMLE